MVNYFSDDSLVSLNIHFDQSCVDSRVLATVLEIKHQTLMDLVKLLEPRLRVLDSLQFIYREDQQITTIAIYPFTYLSELQVEAICSRYIDYIILVKSPLYRSFKMEKNIKKYYQPCHKSRGFIGRMYIDSLFSVFLLICIPILIKSILCSFFIPSVNIFCFAF